MTTTAASGLPAECLKGSFVDSLPEPFLGIARECIPLDVTNKESLLPATERADLLEIQLRSQLLKLIQESLVDATDEGALEDVGVFWRSSLELCLHLVHFCDKGSDERYRGMSVRKLPLLLLEDALDALPLKSFQQIWESVVEPSFDIVFANVFWNPTPKSFPCSLPFIKLCNKFLRKLDAHKDDWPGRILMTLAKAFSLSDKSATKIWGSFNSDNVTEFESQEEFDAQQKEQQSSDHHDSSIQHPHHNKQLQTYNFYETFWSVQQDFSNPTGIKVADFLERMRTILAALESHPLIRSHTITLDGADNNQNNATPPQVKYLTSSHLLPIQLGDPEFRIHFLTQFLIVENHLSSESPALGNMLGGLHKRAKDLLGRIQPHGHKHLQILEFLLQHREKYWRQWKKNKCQPDLETPLVPIEEASSPSKKRRLLDGPLGDDAAAASSKKKKDEEEQLIDFILHEKKDLKATCALSTSSSSSNNNNKNRNTRSKVVPSLEEHLEPYVDALDPDAGIEPEYHPKNDSLFTWRALRLLSRDHLGKFHMINHKGDFEKMVRHIWAEEKGIQIPGEAPAAEEIELAPTKEDEDDEEEGMDETEDKPNDEAIDEEMMDAAPEEKLEKADDNKEDVSTGDMASPREESQPGTPADKLETIMEQEESKEKEEGPTKDEKTDRAESPVPMDDEPPLDDDDDDDDAPLNDDDSDEPTRVKEEIESEDEGEIEESGADKSSEAASPASGTLEDEKESQKEQPPKEQKDDHKRGGDRRDEDRQQQRRGDFHGKGRQTHRGGGGRSDGPRDKKDGPYNREHQERKDVSYNNHRDHNRDGPGRQHHGGRGGGGGGGGGGGYRGPSNDMPGGGRRDDMPGGGRRDDRRFDDTRWAPRRDDRRGGGGGGVGDRRGDRRGRGDGRRRGR